MLTNEQIAEVLDTAADDIDTNGWQRFFPAYFSRPYLHGGPGAMSALGAIQNVITGSPARWDTPSGDPRHDDIDQVMDCLNQRFIRLNPDDLIAESLDPFMTWHSETDFPSSRPRRDKAEILAFLRAAAEELRTNRAQEQTDAQDEDHPGWVCPECGEDVQEFPPHRVPPAVPLQAYSHLDGEPLCPVIEPSGYVPAQPVRKDSASGGEH